MEVDSFGKGGKKDKKGKGDGTNGKKGDRGQHQKQNPDPGKDVVCWHCGKRGHLSTECWSISKNQSGSGGIQKQANENRRTSQAKEQARWNSENKLQWCNHSRSRLLRALWTWRQVELLSDHRTLIPKVG